MNPHLSYSRDTDQEGQWNDGNPWFERVRPLLTGIPPTTVVLDCGCNSGGLGRRLTREMGCFVVGIDLAFHLLPEARKKGYVAVLQADAAALPFRRDSFPVVVLSDILEHVDDPVACVEEAARVLMPRGWLLGDVPTFYGKWGFRSLRGHKWHRRAWFRSSLQDVLSRRFHVESIHAVPSHPTKRFLLPQWYCFKATKT